ncbi:hypothetical protein F5X99DRAFT_281405 [Biscogniauxia marginata]|nr:hypothetical protein F5X99DRAFT_281405 [Biscogniauxia marginata]
MQNDHNMWPTYPTFCQCSRHDLCRAYVALHASQHTLSRQLGARTRCWRIIGAAHDGSALQPRRCLHLAVHFGFWISVAIEGVASLRTLKWSGVVIMLCNGKTCGGQCRLTSVWESLRLVLFHRNRAILSSLAYAYIILPTVVGMSIAVCIINPVHNFEMGIAKGYGYLLVQ